MLAGKSETQRSAAPRATAPPVSSSDHAKLPEATASVDLTGITKQRALKSHDVNIKAIRTVAPTVACDADGDDDDDDAIPPL
jgi:hypothetical protein